MAAASPNDVTSLDDSGVSAWSIRYFLSNIAKKFLYSVLVSQQGESHTTRVRDFSL